MEPVEDLRVVRGPDWDHGEEDGGEGHLGTVVKVHADPETEESSGSPVEDDNDVAERAGKRKRPTNVTVQWDMGHRGVYKCGEDGKYELRVYDTAQTGRMYMTLTCDGCRASPVLGTRWKCSKCFDYDLCTDCYMKSQHSDGHKFVRYDTGHLRTMMKCRRGARSMEIRGILPGAEVARGHDWSWGQQDGGSGTVGKVTEISTWDDKHYRGSVEVEWPEEAKKSYRIGCEGMVDLKCVTAASGGKYYPGHLQVLGAPYCPPDSSDFASSDYVRVELDKEIFEIMQANHGGYNSSMADLRGELGVIYEILDNGDLRVSYGPNKWIINPSAVVKVGVPVYQPGDVVRVMDDLGEVAKLQKNHGGWIEDMAGTVGHLGSVQGVNSDGNVAVLMKTRMWTFNPLCLRRAEKGEEEEVSTAPELLGEESRLLELQLQVLVEREDSELLHHAAILGNLSVIRDYLDKYPNEVDAKFTGKTALHCAMAAGKKAVAETLLEFGASLESEDSEGFKPLHHCALRDKPEMASFLLEAGCDPNSRSKQEHTPLIVAAHKGHTKILDVLVKWPAIKLSDQDKDGDTALHCAVHGRKYQSLCVLLDAGADPSLINFNILTPLHLAVKVGFLPAVECLVRSHPGHVNVGDNIRCTPLHLATTEGEVETVKTLLNVRECEVDARAETSHTPLHGTIMKNHSRVVELLIGHGADPTLRLENGTTPLHLVLDNEDMEPPSVDTPELNKVKELLSEMSADQSGQLVVACFLIREGGDISSVDSDGDSALDNCSPEMAVIVSEFSAKYARTGKYRGSLRRCYEASAEENSVSEKDNKDESASSEVDHQEVDVEVLREKGGGGRGGGGGENVALESADNNPQLQDDQTSSTGEDKNSAPTPQSQPNPIPTQSTLGNPSLCFLCDTPITIKFEPCGHSPLCHHCGKRARKCPDCKTPIQALCDIHA